MKSCCVFQDHYDDERDKTVSQQHQTCKTKTTVCRTKTDFFGPQTGLVLRPTVSDHITGVLYRISDSELPLSGWMFTPGVYRHERPVFKPSLRTITRPS